MTSRYSPEDSVPIALDEVARNWDANSAAWADDVRAGRDVYRQFYNNPAFLAFLGDLGGKTVLDAGCGEGYNTRIFARRGARMTGVDLSARMIELAREEERRAPLGIRYEVASYTAMAQFADRSFDAAVSSMALMDGPDFDAAMCEILRVLRPGASLCFSIIHPCFSTKGFAWIHDESGREVAMRQARYFDDSTWVEHWRFSRLKSGAKEAEHADGADEPSTFAVPRFDRTLSYYVNALIGAGFTLREMHEPRPSEEACREHPWLRRWREHAPLFLYFRALKP